MAHVSRIFCCWTVEFIIFLIIFVVEFIHKMSFLDCMLYYGNEDVSIISLGSRHINDNDDSK